MSEGEGEEEPDQRPGSSTRFTTAARTRNARNMRRTAAFVDGAMGLDKLIDLIGSGEREGLGESVRGREGG